MSAAERSDVMSAGYPAEFQRAEHTLPGSAVAWVRQARRAALSRFADLGFPTPRDERWKYTRLTPLERRTFMPRAAPATTGGAAQIGAHLITGLDCHLLVFVDGHYVPGLGRSPALPEGVTLNYLAGLLDRQADVLAPHLGKVLDGEGSPLTALNTAFLSDGAYLHVPAETVIEEPIHLLFVATGQEEGTASHLRNLIVAERNSRATVIESYVALGEQAYLTNAVTEVMAGPGAAIEHYKLQQEASRAVHVGGIHVRHERDSRFTGHTLSFGGALVRNEVYARLEGEGSVCALNGLYLAGSRQHVDNHIRIDHAKPRGTSRQLFKGVLAGRGRGVFDGKVVVHQDAQRSDAEQVNKNLLLSEDAEADTRPQLEIYADDVRCTHGATVGQLDADSLFYLRSRGISQDAARALLTYGFAGEVLDRISLEPLRTRLNGVLMGRLGEDGNLGLSV